MARPRSEKPTKSSWICFRCTQDELASWKRLAAKRQKKTLVALIQDSLNLGVSTTCLCEPGLPACPKCSKP